MQISGHNNVQSINNYSSLNSRQLQTISTIISAESQTRERSAQPSHSELPANCGLSSIFTNSTISGNIEININNHASRKPPVKRKWLVIKSSDSSQERLLFTFRPNENANLQEHFKRTIRVRLTFPSFLTVCSYIHTLLLNATFFVLQLGGLIFF